MTVQDLIETLSKMDKDKIVIMTEPSGIGYTKIPNYCRMSFKVADNGCKYKQLLTKLN